MVSLCGSFFDEKSTVGALVRMVGGLLLAFVMLSPVAGWDFAEVAAFAQTYDFVDRKVSMLGSDMAAEAVGAIITEKTSAYILDKASNLGADLSVEVTLSSDSIPVPESVYLSGSVSPYAKRQLQHIIDEELGIPKERQIWTG